MQGDRPNTNSQARVLRKKNTMKNQNSNPRLQSRSEQSGANRKPDFVRHCENRRLNTDAVLNHLRTRLPRQYELAEVVGKWVWLDVSPVQQARIWLRCFGLWASIGISGAVSGSIRAAALTRSALIPPTRAPIIAPIFPPTFYLLESVNAHIIYAYTRSQAVACLTRRRGADGVSAWMACMIFV